ncbi:hypothetical protein C2E21_3333 [Chlorella sorokiniana]|uniref:Uncharacterized protein n=1 Tax=Chlorella sorokiniana TaxID=3076 RepID=A0A2P6TUU1_CHLSO|nr:hypothetical protein C2E21_3333 [Chlorella sorokiniana]|eukprot:PRW57828.1 hypothetical protein C2E21_3333 [Chlorella sorokiniana]
MGPASASASHSSELEAPAAAAREAAVAGVPGRPGQHLLKHAVSSEVRAAAIAEFGVDQTEAGTAICRLRQPNLRAMFSKVYGVETKSGNNDWMRGKLLQAVGLPNRWRPAPEPEAEPAGGAQPWADAQQQSRKREAAGSPLAEVSKRGQPTPPAFPSPWTGGLPGAAAGGPDGNQPMVVVVLPGGQLPPWVAGQLGNGGSEGGFHPAPAGFANWPQQAQQAQCLPLQQYGSGCSATGPAGDPQQQLLVLQAATQNPGATMEQAALTALQALGLLPPGAPLLGDLQPAVVAPQRAVSLDSPMVQPNQPVLLRPGQLGNCPWPVVLPPTFEEQAAAAAHAAAAHAAAAPVAQQRLAGHQLWQQQAVQPAPQHGCFGGRPGATACRSVSMPVSVRWEQPAVQCVAAMPSNAAPSPFAAAASIPLPSSAAESEQQEGSEARHPLGQTEQAGQQAEQAQRAQQAQPGWPARAGEPAAPPSAAAAGSGAAQPSLRLPEGSLMADLKALEGLGWSASLANLPMVSADLEHLFKAWQDGRISLSLAPDLKIAP